MSQYVTRAWIVSRSVSPSPPPSFHACTWVTCIEYGCMCHFLKVSPPPRNGFHSVLRLPRYTVFVKSLARSPGYYHWTRIICAVGRLMAVDEREEAFNNGEGVRFIRDFFLLSLINAVTLIYNLAIRVVF